MVRGAALVCFILGSLLIVLSLMIAIASASDSATFGISFLLGFLSAYAFLRGLVYLFNGVRCLRSLHAGGLRLAALSKDARAPVLYLRSFTGDNDLSGSGARIFNPLNVLSWGKLRLWRGIFTAYRSYFSLHWTLEQVIEFATRSVGPLIAIGRRGRLPILGAYNILSLRM